MDVECYRKLQIIAVTGYTGTTEWEIIKVTSWLVFATLFSNLYIQGCVPDGSSRQFVIEFVLMILPQIILFCYPHWTQWLVISVLIPSFAELVGYKRFRQAQSSGQRTFLTNARAAIMIMCMIGILAVDFPVFPRRFVKTEVYGASLMDVGVGCVVVSMGIMAGRSYLIGKPTLGSTMRSTTPLLILGMVRMIMIKAIGYQEHATEYGIHWNFFVTLGILPILAYLALLFVPPQNSFELGGILGLGYQVVLRKTFLESFVLSDQRTTLLEMNKEGIVSLIGYVSLCLMSIGVGIDIFSSKNNQKLMKSLLRKLVVLGSTYYILKVKCGIIASRRLMNFSFVVGTVSLTLIQMMGFIVIETITGHNVPLIAASISFNQLCIFLVVIAFFLGLNIQANMTTGVINLTCYTLLQPDSMAIAIMVTYMFILCGFSILLYISKIRIKL